MRLFLNLAWVICNNEIIFFLNGNEEMLLQVTSNPKQPCKVMMKICTIQVQPSKLIYKLEAYEVLAVSLPELVYYVGPAFNCSDFLRCKDVWNSRFLR